MNTPHALLVAALLVAPALAQGQTPSPDGGGDVPFSSPMVSHLHLMEDDSGAGSGSGVGGGWTDRWTPEGRTFGVGLQLGFPSAITVEGLLSEHTSIVAGVGAFGYRFFSPALSFYVDYLWHPSILAHPGGSLVLSWYIGVGGWLSIYEDGYHYTGYAYGGDSNASLAVRVPIGLDLSLGPIPLMFYGELVPTLLVFPDIDIGLGASIGVRLFF